MEGEKKSTSRISVNLKIDALTQNQLMSGFLCILVPKYHIGS